MPSTIVQSPAFAQRGIALNESSCVEQVNGLVEVQTRFTIAKSRQQEIDRLFYVDAPPPIDPACIAKSSLLTNRLYMQSRSISSNTGFLTIDASYVGGLARAGFRGFYLVEDKSPIVTGTNFYAVGLNVDGDITLSVNGIPATRVYNFEYFSKEITIEFVEIGGRTATGVPEFTFDDLFVFVKLISAFGAAASMSHGEDVIFGSQLGFGPPSIFGPRPENLISTFNKVPVRTQEPATFATPTVKVAKIRYSL